MLRRLLREEEGFTLTEMLVTMILMLMVMFALYSLFDMSIRVFAFGNDKVEAVENARLGLDKMARELRGAYPADRVNGKTNLFWNEGAPGTALAAPPPANGPITFGNDLNGNRRIYDPATGNLDPREQITYRLSGSTLQRRTSQADPWDPVAEDVKDVDGDGQALTFTYLDQNGNTTVVPSEIRTVRVKLELKANSAAGRKDATQILQTDVTLRNRSG
jgi:prepilin-type N-terminal cleavage/methylation domain-containing protein